MSNVRVVVKTKDHVVAVGTTDEQFVYTISAGEGAFQDTQTSTNTEVVFADVPEGEYEVVVTKMGFEARGTVTVDAPEEPETTTLQVPDTVTVTVE